MYRKKGRGWTKHIDFMLLDVLCMQIAFIVSYIWRFGPGNPYIDKDYRLLAVAFLLIDFFVEIVSDAFKNVLKRGYLDEFIATCKHVALVEIITTFFLFTTQMGEIYSRMSYYIMIPIYILVSYIGRVVLKKIIKKRGFASSKKSLFVIAPEKLLEETLHGLKENGFGYTQIVAAATDADLKGKTICEIPIVANHDGIVDYACEEWVDEVLIPPCAESEYPYEMADIFLEMGIAVHRGITKNKAMAGSFNQIEKIGDYTVITASMNYASTTQLLAKRGMDILGGLVGCIITLIVTIFVGPAIYIASPGPIFFAQERIGRNIHQIDVMVTEGERLENARCKIIFCEIAALAPTRLSVFRFFYIINLRILFSAFSSERIDERFFIGCKLEPAFRKIACQHFALHRQRIDGDELQCAILLFFSGNTAVARLLREIQFIA